MIIYCLKCSKEPEGPVSAATRKFISLNRYIPGLITSQLLGEPSLSVVSLSAELCNNWFSDRLPKQPVVVS